MKMFGPKSLFLNWAFPKKSLDLNNLYNVHFYSSIFLAMFLFLILGHFFMIPKHPVFKILFF